MDKYIKPEAEVIEILAEEALLSASPVSLEISDDIWDTDDAR